MSTPARVLVADDHAPTREDVRVAVEADPRFTVVALAGDAAEAVQAALREQPDVALLDMRMPGGGAAAAWEITARLPGTRAVMLTVSRSDEDLFAALRAGAAGYLLKNAPPPELARAVRAAHAGEALLDPVVAARLVETLAGDGDPLDRLTPREREVLELIGRGFPNKRIARRLEVSEKTVKTHVGHVLAKLGVTDRTQAAVVAVRAGLVDPRS
jgi:DNA-binding NarL/FixJ family response regulator